MHFMTFFVNIIGLPGQKEKCFGNNKNVHAMLITLFTYLRTHSLITHSHSHLLNYLHIYLLNYLLT